MLNILNHIVQSKLPARTYLLLRSTGSCQLTPASASPYASVQFMLQLTGLCNNPGSLLLRALPSDGQEVYLSAALATSFCGGPA
jgi:hypothetical protein